MTPAPMTPQKAIALMLIAAALFVAGGLWYSYNFWFTRTSQLAVGEIIAFEDGGKVDHPVIRFTTSTGEVIQFTASGGQDSYAVGDEIELYYDPTQPGRARLNSFIVLWFGPMMLALVGCVDGVLGFMFYRKARAVDQSSALPPMQ